MLLEWLQRFPARQTINDIDPNDIDNSNAYSDILNAEHSRAPIGK